MIQKIKRKAVLHRQKMIIELEPASESSPVVSAPPDPEQLKKLILDGVQPAHPSRRGLGARRLQMQINNIQHRLHLLAGADGQ